MPPPSGTSSPTKISSPLDSSTIGRQEVLVGEHRVGLAVAHRGDGFVGGGEFDQRRAGFGDVAGLDRAGLRRR